MNDSLSFAMRIRTKSSRTNVENFTLNLASMIDVTFLLLIFFMVTTVLIRPEDRLTPLLKTRSDETAAQQDFQPQRIEVLIMEGLPTYRLSDQQFTISTDLQAALMPLPKEPGIFINVEDQVPIGFAVGALQAAHDAGFTKVTYVPVS